MGLIVFVEVTAVIMVEMVDVLIVGRIVGRIVGMIVEMSKGSDIGKFTGTYYTFSMTAQIFTPILSGFLLENVSYRTLFPYAFVFSALAFVTMTQVRHGDARPDKKKNVLENFDVDD